jgi:hypothetical protein
MESGCNSILTGHSVLVAVFNWTQGGQLLHLGSDCLWQNISEPEIGYGNISVALRLAVATFCFDSASCGSILSGIKSLL